MGVNTKILCKSLLVAEGLRCLLESSEQIVVTGLASSIDALVKRDPSPCDVLVVDIDLAIDVLSSADRFGRPRVLLISNKHDNAFIYENLKDHVAAGLSGIIATDSDHSLFEKAIMKIHSGELWIDNMTLSKSFKKKNSHEKNIQITKKEAEVLDCVCTGDSNKKIAQKLRISEQTVKSHCNHLFKKFGVENRVKLVLCASKMASTYEARNKILQ